MSREAEEIPKACSFHASDPASDLVSAGPLSAGMSSCQMGSLDLTPAGVVSTVCSALRTTWEASRLYLLMSGGEAGGLDEMCRWSNTHFSAGLSSGKVSLVDFWVC